MHLVGFIIKKIVTMHGHMNVKKRKRFTSSIIRQYKCLHFANFIPQRLVRTDISARIDRHGSSASEDKLLSAVTVSAH